MTATRRQAREWAIQMLTAADLNPPADNAAFAEDCWRVITSLDEKGDGAIVPKGKLRAFAEERFFGVMAHLEEIDATIGQLLDKWDLYRLGTIERVVLRMGVWEMKWSDVPRPVVINEAIDLANWFSTPKSRSLVNGVLDKLAKTQARLER